MGRGVAHVRTAWRAGARLAPNVALCLACAAAATLALSGCSSWGSDDAAPTTTAPPDPAKTKEFKDRSFVCRGEVDLDLVRVTMRTAVEDAISLDANCTGRIGRIEVETWTADGIKVQNYGRVAHDLVIESGYVKCHDIAGEYHQDGVQVMGGRSITFRDLRIDCFGNSNFFVAKSRLGAVTPTDVVCDGCALGPNAGQTLFYADSIRSGARNTTICTGRFRAIRIEPGARAIVEAENKVLPHDDPSCADVTGQGAR